MASSTFVASSGGGYELLMGRWSRRLAEPFLDFCGCSDGETVLDAGCGTGSLTFALAQRARDLRIQAIDIAPAYIEYATQHNHNPNIAFRVGDVGALPFADASFDRVLSLLSFTLFPTPIKRWQKCAASLVGVRPWPQPYGMPGVGW